MSLEEEIKKNYINKKEVQDKIYTIFRYMMGQGHMEIKQKDNTQCYVCQILYDVERKINSIFGEKEYKEWEERIYK